MDGIQLTLKNLTFAQMVLAWFFVGCYSLALGGMLGPKGSLRSGGLALLAALSFAALSDNWVHGALLVLFAIAGMGLFVALSWAMASSASWFVQRGTPRAVIASAPPRPAAARQPALGGLRALWRSLVTP